MLYRSTADPAHRATFREEVLRGTPPGSPGGGGLYVPESPPTLPAGFADGLAERPLEETAFALARAFIHRPKILFADEPTGNLDAETSEPIVEMLFRLNREAGTALVLVTHDPGLAARAHRVVKMRAGTIVAEEKHGAR